MIGLESVKLTVAIEYCLVNKSTLQRTSHRHSHIIIIDIVLFYEMFCSLLLCAAKCRMSNVNRSKNAWRQCCQLCYLLMKYVTNSETKNVCACERAREREETWASECKKLSFSCFVSFFFSMTFAVSQAQCVRSSSMHVVPVHSLSHSSARIIVW